MFLRRLQRLQCLQISLTGGLKRGQRQLRQLVLSSECNSRLMVAPRPGRQVWSIPGEDASGTHCPLEGAVYLGSLGQDLRPCSDHDDQDGIEWGEKNTRGGRIGGGADDGTG